ncbi:MAG: hypothetical protein AB7U41_01785 [Dongiaceae bacterium]
MIGNFYKYFSKKGVNIQSFLWPGNPHDYATGMAIDSQLPGRENGPADAYRHVLGAAELTRQVGYIAAAPLSAHETTGHLLGSTAEEEVMDGSNNEIGIRIGIYARENKLTREQTNELVQKVMTDPNYQRIFGQPRVMKESTWKDNPVYDNNGITPPEGVGKRMPNDQTNWPPDFSRPNRNNPYHPDYDPAAKRSESGPEKEIHPALRGIDIETGEKFSEMPLRKHLERRFDLKEKYQGKKGANGPVFVRAHSREGRKIHVDSYTRQPPEGGPAMN